MYRVPILPAFLLPGAGYGHNLKTVSFGLGFDLSGVL